MFTFSGCGTAVLRTKISFVAPFNHSRHASVPTVEAVRKASLADVAELLPLAYDDTPMHLWPLARLSLEAHLEKLVKDGTVRERDGRYCLAPQVVP